MSSQAALGAAGAAGGGQAVQSSAAGATVAAATADGIGAVGNNSGSSISNNAGLAQTEGVESVAHRVESEIPDELKEYPPPESLVSLDRQMDALLDDIRILLDARNKEFQITGESRNRMPLFPMISKYEVYKSARKDNVEGILKVEMPSRKVSASEVIQKEIKHYWSVEDQFEGDRMFDLLLQFFDDRARRLLAETHLLVSRWSRFCRTSFDVSRFYDVFKRRHDYLRVEFTDTANRFERLFSLNQLRVQKKRADHAAEEAARIEAERRGMAVMKNRFNAVAQKKADIKAAEEREDARSGFSALADELSLFGPPEVPDNPGFEVGDLAIYLRWLISTDKERRDFNVFVSRGKLIAQSDREQLVADYRFLGTLKPGDDLADSLESFDGLNAYIEQPPLKTSKLEDFITEYDLLVSHWKVETPINQEDGRPFAYEIDSKFFNNFAEQTMEMSLAPYETMTSVNESGDSGEKNSATQYAGNSGLDSFTSSLSGISGYTQRGHKVVKFPKLRRANWLDAITLVPEFDVWQEAYHNKLAHLKETDMELRLEHDLLLSSDHEYVGTQLKDTAKRIWESAATLPNSKPITIKISIIPQQREYKPTDAGESRLPKMFDFGIKIPVAREEVQSSEILASKKKDYGMILKANEDNRKLEMELMNADPGRNSENGNMVNPTIATVFAEHEVLAYLQLRFVKIRQVRVKLLRQFNFLRSVEKRLNMDQLRVERQKSREDLNDTSLLVARMWRQAEFVDMSSLSNEPGKTKPVAGGENASSSTLGTPPVNDMNTEDIRMVVNDKIQVTDPKGVSFVYDVAMSDMEQFESEMMKILTLYINASRTDDHISPEYLDELRFRTANRRTEIANVTYLNPPVDRSQMMLEYYEAHLTYQYEKIELINGYLEAYENITEMDRAKEIAQIITNIIHMKPRLNFDERYFSRCFTQSAKAFELHSQLVVNTIRHLTASQRVWCKRYTARSKPRHSKVPEGDRRETSGSGEKTASGRQNQGSQHGIQPGGKDAGDDPNERSPESFFDSILRTGLPHVEDPDQPTAVMHHPEITVQLTEVVPALENLIYVWNMVQSTSAELCDIVDSLEPEQTCSKNVVDCVTLKWLNSHWESMADHKFQMPARTRRIVGNLDSNVWLHNPYLPDALLSEYYVPYDQTDEGTYKSLGVQLSAPSYYTDASFQANGREILYRAIKVIILRGRLLRVWMESEHWRKTYESQFAQMGVNKANYCGRLGPLRFDAGNASSPSGDGEAAEEDAEEGGGGPSENVNDSEEDLSDASKNTNALKFGPLAISELDELQNGFDVHSFQGIASLMRPAGILRLKQALKIQLLEKNWLMAAAELQNLLLGEIHSAILKGKKPGQPDDVRKSQARSSGVNKSTEDVQANGGFDVDYRTLVTTNLGKKKHLRRILLAEYSKEYKSLLNQDITENQKEQALGKFKTKLIDWYHANMCEVVAEECERTEFAKLIALMRKTAEATPFGKLIFLSSTIKRHSDYFAGIDEGRENEKQRFKQSVQTQELVSSEAGLGTERLGRLWYLPHLTEIILTMSGPDKPHKGAVDLSHRIFRNRQIYFKSTKIHSLVHELFTIVTVFSHLLQDHRRYAASVKQLREADYIVSTMNLIKRDLLNQGEPAEYIRVQNFLSSRWQFWYLKLKYALSFSIHTLDMNMFPMDRAILAAHYDKCITKKFTYLRKPKRGKHEKPLNQSKASFVVTRTHIPTYYVFGSLSSDAKRLCDSKVQEIEEGIEEYFQVIQFNGSEDDMTKSLTDYLTSNIKLLALRRDYFQLITDGKPFRDEAAQAKFFQRYKMRIIVPSIRLYHKSGAKGNASTSFLLQDEIISGNAAGDFNRIARGAFDKCQQTTLQNELTRDFTAKLVKEAQEYFDRLTDERLGRLFRTNNTVNVVSSTDSPELAFRVSEEDYNTKMSIFNTFLSDLHHASVEFMQDLKDKQTIQPVAKGGRHQPKAEVDVQAYAAFDDKKVFACKKEFLGQSIVRLATHLNQWKCDRVSEQERFVGALYGHLLETIRNCERIILFQVQEKRDMMMTFRREARLVGHELALDTYSELASMAVELSELRKNRKIDERKLRNRILDEYDSLVQELIKEIGVLRHRFHEYQIGNLNDVMNIMAEAKKEQLIVMTQNEDLPLTMRETASAMIMHEEQLASLREQNHELKMTVLKIRSMFTMKEQALKCSFNRQLRKLSDDNKVAEEKLWDSYRDAEARERALRKQMAKLQKTKSTIEFQNEMLHRQLREEQTKPRTNASMKSGAAAQMSERAPPKSSTMRSGKNDAAQSHKLTELEDRLRRYEGINIDNLIQELANKTTLLEEMIQEKRDKEKQAKRATQTAKDTQRRVKSARWNGSRSPSPTPPSGESGPEYDSVLRSGPSATGSVAPGARAASAAEPETQEDRNNIELNSHMVDKVHELMRENKALRRKLFLNGIQLPPESRMVTYLRSGYGTPRFDSGVATSTYNSRVASPDRSRPRTGLAPPQSEGSRRSAGILRNSVTPATRHSSAHQRGDGGDRGGDADTGDDQAGQFPRRPQTANPSGNGNGNGGGGGGGAGLPPLERTPVYARLGSGKQVGFARDPVEGDVQIPAPAHRTSLSPMPPDTDPRQRPQTAPLGRRVSFTHQK